MLLWNALVPLTANALLLNNSGSEGLFLPVPRQLTPTSHNSIISHNSVISHNSISTSISGSNSFPCSTMSNLNSNSYYYNNSSSWANKTRLDWNPCLAIFPFLNIPRNLIVPEACLLVNQTNCPAIVVTQRDAIIIATAVFDARIFGLGGNDIIQCGPGICKVFTGFGNNVLMSGPASTAQLYAGSGPGGHFRPGNNIFIGAGGETLMVGSRWGNDQFYAGSNGLTDGGNDIMIGGSGANYFDCGPFGNGVILDFNPAKGDTKASNCKFVITGHSDNIFGGPELLGRILSGGSASASHVNDTNASNSTSIATAHTRVPSSPGH